MHKVHTLLSGPARVQIAPACIGLKAWPGLSRHDAPADSSAFPLDEQFIQMLDSYRGCGGLARAEEVLAWLEGEVEQGLFRLARWIALRQVVSFEWQAQTWLPLFQFDRRDMSLRPALAPVVAELCGVFDAWELAHWFARPNSTLAGLTPAETLRDDPASVLQAARTDRFAIEG